MRDELMMSGRQSLLRQMVVVVVVVVMIGVERLVCRMARDGRLPFLLLLLLLLLLMVDLDCSLTLSERWMCR